MTGVADLILIFGVFLGLLLGGMWIPFAIGISGITYLVYSDGWDALRALGLVAWGGMNSFTLTAIPLFILMAELLLKSGISDRVYRSLAILVRRLPGGLLQTNIAGCAVFSAISGSSVATAAAIGTVALPQLQERSYDRSMATGSLAAGGTLGILIPPSIAMILYGTFTEVSIAKLFAAGLLPGILLALSFMCYIAVTAIRKPEVAPREAVSASAATILRTVADLLPFVVLIFTVLGGIYFGLVTPTESAALGCAMSIVVCRIWGKLDIKVFRSALQHSIMVTGSVMFIVLAAFIFSYAVAIGGLAINLTQWLVSLDLSKFGFIFALVIMYTVLGCLVESIGMLVITVPLLFPVLLQYGIDPIWFGVILVLLIELGQITPPLGINLFVIQGIARCNLGEVVRGALPYYLIILAFVALLAWVPEIALWLPNNMTTR